ncbi:N-6 DNA methylase [bacterium]|nr:N-6 DNA methylase [bacterium]
MDSQVIAAAFAISWLAEDEGAKWPPQIGSMDDLPQELSSTMSRFTAFDAVMAEPNLAPAIVALSRFAPRETWLADDILGWVYEFLNEASSRRGKGQYYTPGWVVELIIRLCSISLDDPRKGSSKQSILQIDILDPACGCGTFLLSATRLLHNSPSLLRSQQGHQPEASAVRAFGLDVDPKALTLAKMSFALLRRRLGQQSAIRPPSLHELDFLNRSLGLPFSKHVRSSGDAESDPASLRRNCSTFDMIIGNPPYLGFHHHSSEYRQRVLKDYSVFNGKADIFYYFIERGLESLREGGVLGYVIPRYWLAADKASRLRSFIADEAEPLFLIDMDGMRVFERARIQVCLLILRKRRPAPSHSMRVVRISNPGEARELLSRVRTANGGLGLGRSEFAISKSSLGSTWMIIPPNERAFTSSIEAAADLTLKEIASVSPGLITGADRAGERVAHRRRLSQGVFVLTEDELSNMRLCPKERSVVKPWIKNSHVKRWHVRSSDLSVLYVVSEPDPTEMPNLARHLEKHRRMLESRYEIGLCKRSWWRLIRPRTKAQFERESPKIVVPYKAARSRFAVDYGRHYCSADVYCINPGNAVTPEYLCCLLNSSLLEFYMRRIAKKMGMLYEYYAHTLARLPIKVAPHAVQQEFARLHNEVVGASRALEGHRANQVIELERQINRRVFELYDIEPERLAEIDIVP